MKDMTFDAISRRAAVFTLCGNGLAALALPLAAGARNRKKKGKRSDVYTRCQKQVGQCRDVYSIQCAGDLECLASIERCCQVLATCDFAGLYICFADPQNQLSLHRATIDTVAGDGRPRTRPA